MKLVNKMRFLLTFLFLSLFSNIFAQNTTKLVVSGQGNTQLEAQHNALRSAIEQASGAFISSNTEILNDEVIKDEIISITNGNIQEFNIISEIKIPNGEYAVTLQATVSLQKLISFINNNGGQAELNGGLFAANVKQQVLNEENEVKTIQNMCNVLDKIAKGMFTYKIRVGEPISVKGDNSLWQIKMQVKVGFNDNSSTYAKYMFETIDGLKMTKEEISSYLKLNKDVFPVTLTLGRERPKEYDEGVNEQEEFEKEVRDWRFIEHLRMNSTDHDKFANFLNDAYSGGALRSNESINLIINQLLSIKEQLLDFEINNEIRPIKGRDYYNVSKDAKYYSFILLNEGYNVKHTFQGTLFGSDEMIGYYAKYETKGYFDSNQEREDKRNSLYKKLPEEYNKFFNYDSPFWITYEVIDLNKHKIESLFYQEYNCFGCTEKVMQGERRSHYLNRLENINSKERVFTSQFGKVLLIQKETDWWKYCATINKKGGVDSKSITDKEVPFTQRNLGLVISFSNFYNTQYFMSPTKYTSDGKIESLGGFETNNGIATLIYKQNLTLEEIGKIKDYKINK